mmetsp:Transcript_14471/g.26181  ORF Transcript_14471/g.26181 Transcript_14471/m.26181 type:complete len:344 (+) Transcript_14471:1136-2167(+)
MFLGLFVALVDDLLDVAVNVLLQLLRDLILGHHPHDHILTLSPRRCKTPRTDVRETKVDDHLLGHACDLLQISASTGGDLCTAKDDLLGSTTPQSPNNASPQLRFGEKRRIITGNKPSETLGLTAGNQCHLLHGIMTLRQSATDSVPHLVVCHQGLGLAIGHGGPFHPCHNTVNGIVNLRVGDRSLVAATCQNGALVHEVGKISPREAGGPQSNDIQSHIRLQLLVLDMHPQDLLPALQIRDIHTDLSVKATRSQKGGIQDISAIGGSQHDDTCVAFEAIHLSQQLVQCLLSLVIALPDSRTTRPAHGVNLVHKNQARAVLFRLLEQVTHTRCTYTDEHLHEL